MLKATGIVRKVDNLGRITIPKELCRTRGIHPGTPMELFQDGEKIIFVKYDPTPEIANTLQDLIEQACMDELQTSDMQELIEKLKEAQEMAATIGR
jgi:transcriptional pleiotropic regulator of transition state genes